MVTKKDMEEYCKTCEYASVGCYYLNKNCPIHNTCEANSLITADEARRISDNSEIAKNIDYYLQEIGKNINEAATKGEYSIIFHLSEDNYDIAFRLARKLADVDFDVRFSSSVLFISW